MAALWKAFGNWYRSNVYKSLSKYGLRYEDIIIADHPDCEKALKYIPEAELIARQRRIKRAMHLSLTHTYLPKEIQAIQEPGKFYLKDAMEEQRKLREERERLNNF